MGEGAWGKGIVCWELGQGHGERGLWERGVGGGWGKGRGAWAKGVKECQEMSENVQKYNVKTSRPSASNGQRFPCPA